MPKNIQNSETKNLHYVFYPDGKACKSVFLYVQHITAYTYLHHLDYFNCPGRKENGRGRPISP